MTEYYLPDIPRLYTALAEWMACLIFILPFKKRFSPAVTGCLVAVPEDVFTPLFASARIAGWCANRIEELVTCRRIMRPAYRAVTTHGQYIPMEQRTPHIQ